MVEARFRNRLEESGKVLRYSHHGRNREHITNASRFNIYKEFFTYDNEKTTPVSVKPDSIDAIQQNQGGIGQKKRDSSPISTVSTQPSRKKRLASFPRSAWECRLRRSASGDQRRATRRTQSVPDGIPTEDRGNEEPWSRGGDRRGVSIF